MILKITTGYVTQYYDETSQQWVCQQFAAGDTTYEDQDGDSVSCIPDNPYLVFDMVQPYTKMPTLSLVRNMTVTQVIDWNKKRRDIVLRVQKMLIVISCCGHESPCFSPRMI